jgi:anti-sigma B factor antagonist
MRGLALTIEPLAGNAVRVALRGELDLEHAYTFDEELRRVEAQRPDCVCLDLQELKFLDSCGLARLLAAHRRARRAGRRLVLVRPPATVRRLFALTAVTETFDIAGDLPAAQQA